MSHSSERFPSIDTHQWSRDEDSVDGQMTLMRTSSDKSQQHQAPVVSSEDHPQQQQTPVIVTSSSQGWPSKDDSSLNHRSLRAIQQSEQEYSLIEATSPQGVSVKDENCNQPQQLLPSVGTFSLKDPEQSCLGTYQPQQWPTAVKVPPQRHPSKDVQPKSNQSFHSPQKQQPSDCSTSLAQPSTVNAPTHINDDAPPPYQEEPRKTHPGNITMPKAETLPKNMPRTKSETPSEKDDSPENLPRNVGVRRTPNSPPPSFCARCCT